MATQPEVQSDIQSLISAYQAATQKLDIDALMALYADYARVFDLMTPWESKGADAWRESVIGWFQEVEKMGGNGDAVFSDVTIVESGDLAILFANVEYSHGTAEGKRESMWNRLTWGLGEDNGEWRIFHEHTSAPLQEPEMLPVFSKDA